MHTLHFISHTHWDREWHEPFQIFRIRLAQTINKALEILATDPDYKYFMLDGQTIVLEDYAEIAPERMNELSEYIEQGRVLVGPWYVLPDEFLVSGEAIIRNLQRGIRIANSFGKSMMIGYIPDPFGHISQMPQILAGFGISVAMFRRGLADEPTELWWVGADGTRVLTTYLRDGYDNAAWLVHEPERFSEGVQRLVNSLAPHAVTENLLMMHGTDHMQPWDNLPKLMRLAEEKISDVRIIHSNLPEYAQAVENYLMQDGMEKLMLVKGELRNPKRHHLLPGVTSTRMWIKQRNARAQNLLEQWAEPLAAIAMNLSSVTLSETKGLDSTARDSSPMAQNDRVVRDLRPELRLAWKYLLQNHPHDSICGCSVDQVHDEMAPRFDAVEQIGGDVVKHALTPIVGAIDTQAPSVPSVPILVFNPAPGPRSDAATVQVDLLGALESYELIDANGVRLPVIELGRHLDEIFKVSATADDLRWMFGAAQSGQVDGYILREFAFRPEGERVHLDITVSNQGEANATLLDAGLAQLAEYIANPEIKKFDVRMHSTIKVDLTFFAREVPAYGYKTFWLRAASAPTPLLAEEGKVVVFENEFFRVEPNPSDGTLTITDKLSGAVFAGANRFVDGGDRGDLYNYCAPEQDTVINTPVQPPTIELLENNSVRQILRIQSALQVPASLAPERTSRSDEKVYLPISTVVTLYAGARRIDFHTQVENVARDHRLRVEFPTPIHTEVAHADQAFDIVARKLELPPTTPEWIEQPRPEMPMQKFVTVNDEKIGLTLATRGLPEYEARPDANGVTLALTLLRCIGWLSRPDLNNRRGDAGPEKPTPGAQESGTHFFEYALIPFTPLAKEGEWGVRAAQYEALAFSAPLRAEATDAHSGTLSSSASWVMVSHPDFILTALKSPQEGEGLIVRGFNAGDENIRVLLRPFARFMHAHIANLNEQAIDTLHWNHEHQVEFTAKPREMVTVRFENSQ